MALACPVDAHKPFNLFCHAQALLSHHSHPGRRNERQSLYWRSSLARATNIPAITSRTNANEAGSGTEVGGWTRLIVEARATAMNDAEPRPAPRPRLDIERDELVMA